MHKCNNCGCEFEGKFCPNCGASVVEHKTCPHCGAALASNAKFCNQCGYSFTGNAPSGGVTARAPSKVLPWIKSHLKILIPAVALLIVAIIMLSLIPTFTKASVNGTYYIYDAHTEKTNDDEYFTLKTGKWTSGDGSHGTYTVKGKTVTLSGELFGTELVIGSATVTNGVMRFDDKEFGTTVYVTKNHKHKYGSWQDKDELTCTQDQTQMRTCLCEKVDVKVVTKAKGHQGQWEVIKEATCTANGERKTHCTVCDKDVTEKIEKLAHDLKTDLNATSHFQICKTCEQAFQIENHDNDDCCTICGFPFIFKLNSDQKTYEVTDIYSFVSKTDLIIPSMFNQLSVTRIGYEAFRDCKGLTNVIIGNGVTRIGDSAFYGCTKLTSINIPDSVTSIGEYAFYKCNSLTSITIPDGVTSIGNDAFYDCSSLTSITIPNSVTSIGSHAFQACGLTSVTIGNGVTSIGSSAFYGCGSLTSVTIGNGVTSIGSSAFYGCGSLKSINIPDSVTSIGNEAFDRCTSLTKITIPNSVTSIGYSAFSGCSSLTSITIPNSVTSIGNWAFSGCSSLTSVTIGNSVTSIGNYAFYGCNSLINITIGNDVTSIGDEAFHGCSSLTSITIPNSVKSIGYRAFYDCTSLTIYCEAESKPSGWDYYWNPGNRPVVWGYKG